MSAGRNLGESTVARRPSVGDPRAAADLTIANDRGDKMSGAVARVRAIRLVVLVVALAALWLPASAGAYVYWANYNLGNGTAIGRANLDGTGATEKFITNT